MIVGVEKREDLGDRFARTIQRDKNRRQFADQKRGPGTIAVVSFISHLQRLCDQRLEIDRPPAAERGAEHRPEHLVHPLKSLDYFWSEGAVAKHLSKALIQRRV